MNKPIKPDITIPQSFAENGVKTDFDDTLLADGFDSLRPDVLAGDNLNKFIDDTYKGLNYGMAAADAINLINEGETLTVKDGKLSSGSVGEGFVKKSGDTMTGSLISINPSYTSFIAKSSVMDSTVTPSSHQHLGIDFRDKNDVRVGWMGVVNFSSGSKIFEIQNLGQMNGFNFPKCTTMPTTVSSASQYNVAVVVENYRKDGSWYRVWSDGWKEQGGIVGPTTTSFAITLLKSYSNTNYLVFTHSTGNTGPCDTAGFATATKNKTTSKFEVQQNQIHIIHWYACGY